MTFFIILFVIAKVSSELIVLCPGRRVGLNCSREPPRSGITWRIGCQCSADTSGTCGDTCSSMSNPIDTGDPSLQGTVCEHHDPAITYSITFMAIEENGNILVPSSVLDIAAPLDFHQETSTTLCVECQRIFSRYLIVPGPPSLLSNLTLIPNYNTATANSTEVNLIWLPALALDYTELNVEYTIAITELSSSLTLYNSSITSTSFTARLKFNTTYSITLYSSTCNHMLNSQPFTTNITIVEEETVHLPASTTLKNADTTGENTTPADTIPTGITELMPCRKNNITTILVTTSAQPDCSCVFPTLSIAIAVSALAVVALLLIIIAFTLGVLVGVCRRKTRQQASTTVSAAQSEGASADMSETTTGVELERVHDYEDIVLTETTDMDTFTTNVAYGCTQPH